MYWHRQTVDKPLFPDLIWSRPENRHTAGKLLIMGGNAHSFAVVAESYSQALKSGVGSIRLLLPDSLKSTVGRSLNEVDFMPSTPSGSFAKKSLAELLDAVSWADGLLLCGDLGHNSETAVLLELLLDKVTKPVILTQDAVDYLKSSANSSKSFTNISLVLSLSQLQLLSRQLRFDQAVTLSMDLVRLTDWLHNFTLRFSYNIVTMHAGSILVAVKGEVSSTKLEKQTDIWRVKTAAKVAVWWIQNKDNPFEALSTSVIAE